jgi:intracellular sulfur oxidation DsrE/DsrF family protein
LSKPAGFIEIHERMLDILKRHPEGISINKIRTALSVSADAQQQLDRRLRDLDKWYNIERRRSGKEVLYVLTGERTESISGKGVDKTTRARILHRDGYQCQACGRTPSEDAVKLQIDHKVPREWGGKVEDDNLWALCSDCNEGKRNFFASVTEPEIRRRNATQ